ncbi:hypothetical protein BpHYR1_049340 [Brachionus plicatilis]|uniref:Uncharacterized protein n=1 Tax=Brachionus plicatilis TaxID=10195 RepID=A0A3M7SEF4_BRAPC|nr:hypothetical protein BpHYR1_049340 [Brachionus plicatilis]
MLVSIFLYESIQSLIHIKFQQRQAYVQIFLSLKKAFRISYKVKTNLITIYILLLFLIVLLK